MTVRADSAIGRAVEDHAWLRIPVTVVTRTTELNGNFAANALTLVGFISLFPLLLLIITFTGVIAGPDSHFVDRVVDLLGLSGRATVTVTDTLERARASGAAGSLVGVIGLTWSGLSLVAALQYAVNLPHGYAIRGLRARVTGIPWLFGAGLLFIGSFVVSAILNLLPAWSSPLVALANLGLDIALFAWTFWFLDLTRPALRRLLPGAIAAAIGFTLLKVGAARILPPLISSSSATYGGLGTVFAILAWLLLFSRVFVYSVVFNAVWGEHHAERDRNAARMPTRGREPGRSHGDDAAEHA